MEIINVIAPEHLELYTKFNDKIIKGVKKCAGSILGKFSPEAIGDYLAAPIMCYQLQDLQDFHQVYL